jgi:hypothetical protein
MTFRSLAALLIACAATAAGADDNPYKGLKVGDYAKYTLKAKLGFLPLDGTVTQTLADKTEKEATLKVVLTAGGMDTPFPDQKIDLTRPLDPTKGVALPGFADAKLEKLKSGSEKVKAGGKEYEAEWTTYKLTVTNKGVEGEGELKVWAAKSVPVRLVKLELAVTVGKNDIQAAMELTETGSKK